MLALSQKKKKSGKTLARVIVLLSRTAFTSVNPGKSLFYISLLLKCVGYKSSRQSWRHIISIHTLCPQNNSEDVRTISGETYSCVCLSTISHFGPILLYCLGNSFKHVLSKFREALDKVFKLNNNWK